MLHATHLLVRLSVSTCKCVLDWACKLCCAANSHHTDHPGRLSHTHTPDQLPFLAVHLSFLFALLPPWTAAEIQIQNLLLVIHQLFEHAPVGVCGSGREWLYG